MAADNPQVRSGPLARHFSGRVGALTSAILVVPLLLTYQLGILGGRGQNGVDFVTRSLVALAERDLGNYLLIVVAMLVAYAITLVLLRRGGRFDAGAFAPVLLESSVYALVMGSIILYVMSSFLGVLPGLAVADAGPSGLDVLVISAGAGFHEELIFRAILMGGLAWLLTGVTGKKRAWTIALVASSLVFSLAHHVGPAGEEFMFAAFVYRTLAGMFFAAVYQVRGFAVAAWTHALYDVYVLGVG